MKPISRMVITVVACCVLSQAQTPARRFPPQVLARQASIVGVKTVPEGGKVTVDGVVVPNPFMLLKKDKPRVVRFELAGCKPLEKRLDPGNHYVMGVGVDFVGRKVDVVEFDQPPGTATAETNPVAPASPETTSSAPAASPAEPQSSATAAPPTAAPSVAPFGFEYGMTKEQVIQKLGKTALVKDSGVNVTFSSAPNPHPDFEMYVLAFSPQKGLLKITALSKDIETSDDGAELRTKFDAFLGALREKYGKADKDFDFCKGNDVECRSEYFMLTLKGKNRYLNSFWSRSKANLPPHLYTIGIEAVAMGINKGYIELAYEFDGWNEFVDEINKKRNSTF